MNNKKWQMISYECQEGMYFSEIKKLKNGLIVYSNIVESSDWNFFTEFNANSVKKLEQIFLDTQFEFQKINRQFCFILTPSTKITKNLLSYIEKNYLNYTNCSFMLTKKFNINPNNDPRISYRAIDNKTEADLFIQVFKTSKTQTLPEDVYPALPEYYFTALKRTFNKNKDINQYGYRFINYLSMYNGEPVGMATACVKENIAGLYGGGTFVKYRRQGIFSGLLSYIQKDLNKQGVKYFFGLTEKDSKNEKFYNKIGWKTIFYNKYYLTKKQE